MPKKLTRSFKKALSEQYNNFAQLYSEECTTQDKVGNRRFYEMLAPVNLRGKKLLDVGCGNGNDLAIFCEMGAKAHGIDSSQESVTIARKKCPKATIVVGSGDKLPYPNATFGVVASKYAAQAMLNVPELLQEVARVLKPGGYFILLTKHPLRQFLEKIDTYRDTGTPINYFEQQIVTSSIFEGKIQLREPSHTLLEYLSLAVLQKFDLVDFVEDCDAPASDQLFGLKYATFFVAKFRRR